MRTLFVSFLAHVNIVYHIVSYRMRTLVVYWYAGYRLDNFVIGLTNNNPATTAPVFKSSYTVCAQYSGSVAPGDNVTVICSPSYEKFRFIIVHGSHTSSQALCLTEVFVYARSM